MNAYEQSVKGGVNRNVASNSRLRLVRLQVSPFQVLPLQSFEILSDQPHALDRPIRKNTGNDAQEVALKISVSPVKVTT
jgi:hypothetical protein